MYDAGVSPPGAGDERARATGGAAEASTRAVQSGPAPAAAPAVDRLGKRRRVERLAVGYFKRRAGVGMGARPLNGDAVYFLNPEERRTLRRIERNAVLRAGAAGAFAASLGAVVSVLARPLLGDEPDDVSWFEYLRYVAVTVLTALPVAIVELSFIYWNAIISVHRLAEAAGVALFRPDDDSDDDSDEIFAAVLARAALEIPNPPRPMFGINPRREASRWRLIFASIVYKAKVSLSNFVLRKLLVRAFGRAGLRSWIPFIAVPVTALWDAFVCRRALREARLRAIGPSAARELVTCLLEQVPEPSAELREAMFRAVATAVVRSADFHPNLVELLAALRHNFGDCDVEELDDSARSLALMQRLAPVERRIAVQLLAVACVFDGRIGKKEWAVLARAYALLGTATPRAAVLGFKRGLLNGDALGREHLMTLTPDLP